MTPAERSNALRTRRRQIVRTQTKLEAELQIIDAQLHSIDMGGDGTDVGMQDSNSGSHSGDADGMVGTGAGSKRPRAAHAIRAGVYLEE